MSEKPAGPESGHGGGTKVIIAALLANIGIANAKFVAFLVTGASSMLAESIHSTPSRAGTRSRSST